MLNKFAEELKDARTRSELTLQQIAAKTRIDLKFLENIENANFTFLPELYIKAFIREYSKLVGLDEQITLKKFDAAKKGKQFDELGNTEDELKRSKLEKEEPKTKQPASPQTTPRFEAFDTSNPQPEQSAKANKKQMMTIGIAGGSVIILLIIYFAFIKGSSEIIVTEKPYSEVQRENEQRFTTETPKPQTVDSTYVASSDSLSLTLETIDSSWVKILLDGSKVEEFMLFPHATKEIKALKNYQIKIGNAAAIQFKLNNKPLNFTGSKHEVKYILIESSGLKYLDNPPSLLQ